VESLLSSLALDEQAPPAPSKDGMQYSEKELEDARRKDSEAARLGIPGGPTPAPRFGADIGADTTVGLRRPNPETADEDRPWWLCAAKFPAIQEVARERVRLLREGSNSYALFEKFGRRLCGAYIPKLCPPYLIPPTWAHEELLNCAWNGQTRRVKRLLHEGHVPPAAGCKDLPGCTALHLAAANGRRYTVRALLHAGADANAMEEAEGRTALFLAAQSGHLAILKLLLMHGADVYLANHHGEDPLASAQDRFLHSRYPVTKNRRVEDEECVALLQGWLHTLSEKGLDASPASTKVVEKRKKLAAELYGGDEALRELWEKESIAEVDWSERVDMESEDEAVDEEEREDEDDELQEVLQAIGERF